MSDNREVMIILNSENVFLNFLILIFSRHLFFILIFSRHPFLILIFNRHPFFILIFNRHPFYLNFLILVFVIHF